MSSRTGRRIHFWLLILWIVPGLPLSWVLRQSIPWLVFISVYAIIATHWAGWSAERPSEIEPKDDSVQASARLQTDGQEDR